MTEPPITPPRRAVTANGQTLFHKYGGFSRVASVIHAFYEKLLEVPHLASYFQGIQMERLMRHQTDFLCLIFGGPVEYSGRDLRALHRRLAITIPHFFAVVALLEESLEEEGIEDDDIAAIMVVIRSYQGDIVVEAPI